MKEEIKIGMSSCLLGEEVRWDGDHKYDQYVRDVLGSYFDYVPTCPEVDIGMGTPRETVALYGTLENPKMITKRSKTDWTKKMNHYTKDRIHELTERKSLWLCVQEQIAFVWDRQSPYLF